MPNQTQNQSLQNISLQCKFNELPKPTQERLLSKINDKNNGLVFNTANIVHAFVQIPLALVWFGILFYLSNDYLWSEFQIILFSTVSFIAAIFLIYNAFKLVQWLLSPTKSRLIITPHYIIDVRFNDISYWNMDQLNAVKAADIYQSGLNTPKQIDLLLENGTKFFTVKDMATAEETVEKIDEYKKLFLEATARNDRNYLDSTDDFIELREQTLKPRKLSNKYLKYAVQGVAAAILSGGVMFGAMSLNNYYDDLKSWNNAETDNRASSYRAYLQTHPNGRRIITADQKLQTLYDEAEQKYQAKLNKGFDPKAVEAVKQAIRYAKETKNYKVKLVFERKNEIPADIVEILKKDYEVKRLLQIGDAFTDENMNKRERLIKRSISNVIGVVIPDDILEFADECNGECIIFSVKYIVDSDNIYYDLRQKKLSEKDRTWYPGVWFDWSFDIKTPTNPTTYDFQLTSDPASEISYDSTFEGENFDKDEFEKLLNNDRNFIYDSMAISAFDDFEKNLVYRMGIGEEPIRKPADDEEDSSTPPTVSDKDAL
jgi:hypothetical protein